MKSFFDKWEELLEVGGTKKDIILLVISGIALLLSGLHVFDWPVDIAWVAIILCGIPILSEAIIGLVRDHDITADVLVASALCASVYVGEWFAAGEVAAIMQLGGLLEDLTVARARAGIERLVHLTPRTARVITPEGESVIPAEDVRVGNLLRVLPGESVPVDGVITSGDTSIDQSVMTGESMPVDKTVGDEVSSGTVNQFGAFDMEAVKVGEDSSIQRMVRLVQSADADKAKIVRLADRWAVWVVIIAFSAALLTYLITKDIIRAVTILVVFCPCSLVLATPTAIMAAIGNATKHGFLVSEGDALERLAAVSKITFDKTGTLTYGTPEVVAVESQTDRFAGDELYALAAGAEARSEHPIGKAIVRSFGQKAPEAESFQMIPGKGVRGTVNGVRILAGNEEMLREADITVPDALKASMEQYRSKGCTVILLACDEEPAGLIALSDTLREDSAATIRELKDASVSPVLLTGDNAQAAGTIAETIGISEVASDLLPEDKLQYIADAEQAGEKVCMIGDGVNDAPALKKSYVGIAMGGVGSDIAVDAADIALVNDDIKELPHLVRLSKHMMRVIKANLTFSMTLNFVAITLAILAILNPVTGALVHNAGSVFVIINSAFLLNWRNKK